MKKSLEEFWRSQQNDGSFEDLYFELERFFYLTKCTNLPLAMLGKKVDELWHCMICLTELYAEYCEKNWGGFIHHRPLTSEMIVPEGSLRHFYNLYSEHFGAVPDIWLAEVPCEVIAYSSGRTSVLPSEYRWSGWPGRVSETKA